jgi:hypothetical protein
MQFSVWNIQTEKRVRTLMIGSEIQQSPHLSCIAFRLVADIGAYKVVLLRKLYGAKGGAPISDVHAMILSHEEPNLEEVSG